MVTIIRYEYLTRTTKPDDVSKLVRKLAKLGWNLWLTEVLDTDTTKLFFRRRTIWEAKNITTRMFV